MSEQEEQIQAKKRLVDEDLWVLLNLCDHQGKPYDGFRFREVVLSLRAKIAELEAKEDDEIKTDAERYVAVNKMIINTKEDFNDIANGREDEPIKSADVEQWYHKWMEDRNKTGGVVTINILDMLKDFASQFKPTANELTIEDYKEAFESHKAMVRELDKIINGEDAAEQASLCDIVSQLQTQFKPTAFTDKQIDDITIFKVLRC